MIEAGLTPSEYALPMLDPQTGAIRRVTVAWESALELRVVKTRPRACGYWLAASETEAVRRLRLLGIEVLQLELAGEMRGETYRETGRDAAAAQGGARLRVQTQPILLDVPAGSFFVSLEQPLANLAIAVLEPESPAGYAANGVIADRRPASPASWRGRTCAPRRCPERLAQRARPCACKNGPLRADERMRPRR